MIVLGVDPSLNATGLCVIRSINGTLSFIESCTLKMPANGNLSFQDKLLIIYKKVVELVNKHNISVVFMEETFVNMNSATSMKLSVARGVIMGALFSKELKIKEIPANVVKKSITGNGKADKEQVMFMIKRILPTANFATLDESDAAAIAVAGVLGVGLIVK
ncbi:MAG: Crossover junction endodeoxyribonuclease RuvC [Pseudomonadota bacterium]|jgi:crossover junction endodeoxyribonuclease RuvC